MRLKYNNKITEVDGIRFHSKKEAKRYGELKLLEKAGEIQDLVLQHKLPIEINSYKICTYIADFAYREVINSCPTCWVYEDVKGMKTPVYKLKKKLVEALFCIKIRET